MNRDEYADLRRSIGSQREVARALGVHYMTISKRERGELPIDGEAALAMRCLAEHGPDTEDTRGGTDE